MGLWQWSQVQALSGCTRDLLWQKLKPGAAPIVVLQRFLTRITTTDERCLV